MTYSEYQLSFKKPALFELVRDALVTLGVWKIEANQFQIGDSEFKLTTGPGHKFVERITASIDAEDQEVEILNKIEKALEKQGLMLNYFSTLGDAKPRPYDPFNL